MVLKNLVSVIILAGVFAAPVMAEQHVDMVLVRGEPIINIPNPDETIRPIPGQGHSYVRDAYQLSDGAGFRYNIIDDENPDTDPYREFTANYSFTSPPLIIEPGQQFDLAARATVFGAGAGSALLYDLIIKTGGIGIAEPGYFQLRIAAYSLPSTGSCGHNCYVYEGTHTEDLSLSFYVAENLPQEAWIKVYLAHENKAEIIYPYTLQERPTIIEKDGDGDWFGGAEACEMDTSIPVAEITEFIDRHSRTEVRMRNSIAILRQDMIDAETVILGEARDVASARAKQLEEKILEMQLLHETAAELGLAPLSESSALAMGFSNAVIDRHLNRGLGEIEQTLSAATAEYDAFLISKRRQIAGIELRLEGARVNAAAAILHRDRMRVFVETGEIPCPE